MNRRLASGSSHLVVFLGIVALSAAFFLAFTGFRPFANPPLAAAAPPPSSPRAQAPPLPPRPPRLPTAPPPRFATANLLLEAFAAELRVGDLENAAKLGGPDFAALPATNFLKLLLTKANYRLPPQGPAFREVGSLSPSTRFALALEPASPSAPPPAGPLWIQATRDRAAAAWKLSAVLISPRLLAQATEELRRHGILLDPASLASPPDPLTHSIDFLDAVLGRDFRAARLLTDKSKIAQEKLAGLCIVFEEGQYHLAPDRPIVVTAASPQAAIALVRVHSDNLNADAEIGITLHPSPDGPWTIEALDFSRLLESYIQTSGSGHIFYSPIVKSPQGGESLVVYFDFNQAALAPRAAAQLDIVAALLGTDPAKKLRISGHADDLGSDAFNFQLSAARAKNVRQYLHQLGVNPAQIETIGFGATAPLDPNKQSDGSDNPEGRSRNRRTEIYLDF